MLPHDLCAALAAAEARVDREEYEHVGKAQNVVDDKRAAVVADEVGTVGGNEICKEAEEADGSIIGNDLYDVHENGREVIQKPCDHAVLAAGHLDAEAEENSGDDKRKNCFAAPQLAEVGLGEEVYYHVCHAQRCIDLTLNYGVAAGNDGAEADDDVHDNGRNCSGDEECADSQTHDLACALCAGHVCDSRCYRTKHHGDDDAEHEVYENRADRFENGRALVDDLARCVLDDGVERTDDTAADDTGEHEYYKSVSFKE